MKKVKIRLDKNESKWFNTSDLIKSIRKGNYKKFGITVYLKFTHTFFVYCEECNIKRGLAIHHIDKNRKNNDITNIAFLCNRCHRKRHGTQSKKKVNIIGLRKCKKCDIVMGGGYHNKNICLKCCRIQ